MTRRFLQRAVVCVCLTGVLCPLVDAEDNLGLGYVRRGDAIHFVGGEKNANTGEGTRIDQPGKGVIFGFRRAMTRPVKLCAAPDAASFEVLSEEYTRDKNKVYYKWISPGRFLMIELPNADPMTFAVVGSNLARDKHQVWWYDIVIPDANPATLTIVREGSVYRDAERVWYQHQLIAGADAASFRHLGSGYYRDAEAIYWGPKPIAGVDLATFKVLGDSFMAVDKNLVYRSGQRLPNIDPETCQFILHDPYGYQIVSDKHGVYLNSQRFLHADPSSFEMIDNRVGKDENHAFLVDTYQCNPVTLYWDEDQLNVEKLVYEHGTNKPLAIIAAEVAGDKLEKVRILPPPGEATAKPVSEAQLQIFRRADLIQQMQAAGDMLKEAN
ncbi:MAG: hypothetical protein CBB71_23525 [Rhodopirellula sp. TMED11]|nr:MAG: hypothetical protein CBB71_23525 [Rhodopirellula sp. TMED11]